MKISFMRSFFIPFWTLLNVVNLLGQGITQPVDNPVELGKVHWIRNYDEALQKAQELGKPIFVLFQEVPGCSNCTRYGEEILSHPHLVEIIETEFVPLAIYNNVGGHDREVLLTFKEPAWNNPVVRIIDDKGNDIVKRIGNFKSKASIIDAVVMSLNKSKVNVPKYISLLQNEWQGNEKTQEEAYLSMYCFWTGEKEIGQMKGIVSTEAGYMHGREVVKVLYNNEQTSLDQIIKDAKKVNCADEVYTAEVTKALIPSKKSGSYRKDKEDKYYLRHSDLRKIPMTSLQKVIINSALGMGKDAFEYLSPRQKALYDEGYFTTDRIEQNMQEIWWKILQ